MDAESNVVSSDKAPVEILPKVSQFAIVLLEVRLGVRCPEHEGESVGCDAGHPTTPSRCLLDACDLLARNDLVVVFALQQYSRGNVTGSWLSILVIFLSLLKVGNSALSTWLLCLSRDLHIRV